MNILYDESIDSIIVFGGYGYNEHTDGYLNLLWCYHLGNNTWTLLSGDLAFGAVNSETIDGVENAAMVMYNGSYYVYGGYNDGGASNSLWKITVDNYTMMDIQPTTQDAISSEMAISSSEDQIPPQASSNDMQHNIAIYNSTSLVITMDISEDIYTTKDVIVRNSSLTNMELVTTGNLLESFNTRKRYNRSKINFF